MDERSRYIEATTTGFRKGDAIDVAIEPFTKPICHAPICM
jgi:hypothetical protein